MGADDEVTLRGKILKWGNSYGIRLKKGDIEGTDLAPGREVTVRIEPQDHKIDVSDAPFFHGGDPTVGERHDEVLYGLMYEELQEKKRRWAEKHRDGDSEEGE